MSSQPSPVRAALHTVDPPSLRHTHHPFPRPRSAGGPLGWGRSLQRRPIASSNTAAAPNQPPPNPHPPQTPRPPAPRPPPPHHQKKPRTQPQHPCYLQVVHDGVEVLQGQAAGQQRDEARRADQAALGAARAPQPARDVRVDLGGRQGGAGQGRAGRSSAGQGDGGMTPTQLGGGGWLVTNSAGQTVACAKQPASQPASPPAGSPGQFPWPAAAVPARGRTDP